MAKILKGSELTIFTGDGSREIGCEESCTLSIQSEILVTSTLNSGKAVSRDYIGYDWNVQSNGVVFIQDSFDQTGNLDPFEFTAYILEGLKVVVKVKIEDGSNDKYLIGNGVVNTASYTGSADGFSTYQVEILGDGQLYPTSNLKARAAYDGPFISTKNPSFGVFAITDSAWINKEIYYVLVNDVVNFGYTFNATTGTLTFGSAFAGTETVKIIYG